MIRVYQYEYFEIVTHRELFFLKKINRGERFKKQYILFYFLFFSLSFNTLSVNFANKI